MSRVSVRAGLWSSCLAVLMSLVFEGQMSGASWSGRSLITDEAKRPSNYGWADLIGLTDTTAVAMHLVQGTTSVVSRSIRIACAAIIASNAAGSHGIPVA